MGWLLALPFLLPIVAALVTLMTRRRRRLTRALSCVGCALLVVVALAIFAVVARGGVASAQMGGWPAPFGITLVADYLSAVMLLISAVVGLAVVVFALADIDRRREALGFHSFFQLLLAGVCGSFVTGDLFNLYVWFEVMLIASFALMVLGGEGIQLDAGIKYVALNLVSTLLMLTAIGLLYGQTGTLNMARLHLAVAAGDDGATTDILAVLFVGAFGIKAALFPLFFWLPASYHAPPVAVTAVFSGLLTKVGVYALFRVFTLVFPDPGGFGYQLLLPAALLTMLTGVLGAVAQYEFRKILTFHIISQIGFLVLGLALASPLALAGGIFYMIHNIVAKTNLLLVSGTARQMAGSYELADIGGLYRASPLLAAIFFIAAFSLAGFPPLSGFWAKFMLLEASLDQRAYWVATVILLTGALTLFSMSKIWAEAFWKEHPAGTGAGIRSLSGIERWQYLAPPLSLALVTLVLGIFPGPLVGFSLDAAAALLDPAPYVGAVLGRQ